MATTSTATTSIITEDYMFPTKFCETFGFSYSTTNARIRRGEIALHQFSGEPRPRINVAEALRVMSAIKRPYTGKLCASFGMTTLMRHRKLTSSLD